MKFDFLVTDLYVYNKITCLDIWSYTSDDECTEPFFMVLETSHRGSSFSRLALTTLSELSRRVFFFFVRKAISLFINL